MQRLSILIKKSLDGSATVAELNELLLLLEEQEQELHAEWMNNKEKQRPEVKLYPVLFDRDAIKEKMMSGMPLPKRAPVLRASGRLLKKYLKPAIAAATAGFVMTMVLYFLLPDEKINDTVRAEQAAFTFIEAGPISKVVLLKDSSVVTLYAGSSLRFDSGYAISNRELFLQGSGQFKVKKNIANPFIVSNKHLATTALGTIFEVLEMNDSTVVSLMEGSVKVQSATDPKQIVLLLPGQRAIGNNPARTIAVKEKEGAGSQKLSGKLSGPKQPLQSQPLVFRQMPLTKLFGILKQRYHVNISYDRQELAGLLFTGSFEAGDNIESILQVIGKINNLQVQAIPQGFMISK